MKVFSEEQIDTIVKLKFGKLVTTPGHPAYMSNAALGKLFKCSHSHIRRQYLERFRKYQMQTAPLLQQMQSMLDKYTRQRYGLRFLKDHEIRWIVSPDTLKQQTSLSLHDRSEQFKHEFPTS